MNKCFLKHLFCIFLFGFIDQESFGYSQIISYSNLFPKDFVEAVTFLEDRKTYSKSLYENNLKNYFHDQNQIWPHFKNTIKTSNNIELLKIHLPNLTVTCLLQVVEFAKAFSNEEEWTIKSIEFKNLIKYSSLCF
jgi:hypothetical protein